MLLLLAVAFARGAARREAQLDELAPGPASVIVAPEGVRRDALLETPGSGPGSGPGPETAAAAWNQDHAYRVAELLSFVDHLLFDCDVKRQPGRACSRDQAPKEAEALKQFRGMNQNDPESVQQAALSACKVLDLPPPASPVEAVHAILRRVGRLAGPCEQQLFGDNLDVAGSAEAARAATARWLHGYVADLAWRGLEQIREILGASIDANGVPACDGGCGADSLDRLLLKTQRLCGTASLVHAVQDEATNLGVTVVAKTVPGDGGGDGDEGGGDQGSPDGELGLLDAVAQYVGALRQQLKEVKAADGKTKLEAKLPLPHRQSLDAVLAAVSKAYAAGAERAVKTPEASPTEAERVLEELADVGTRPLTEPYSVVRLVQSTQSLRAKVALDASALAVLRRARGAPLGARAIGALWAAGATGLKVGDRVRTLDGAPVEDANWDALAGKVAGLDSPLVVELASHVHGQHSYDSALQVSPTVPEVAIEAERPAVVERVTCVNECSCGHDLCSRVAVQPQEYAGLECPEPEFLATGSSFTAAAAESAELEAAALAAPSTTSPPAPRRPVHRLVDLHADTSKAEAARRKDTERDVDAQVAALWKNTQAVLVDATQNIVGDSVFAELSQMTPWTYIGNEQGGQNQFTILDGILTPEECLELIRLITEGMQDYLVGKRYRPADVYHLTAPLTAAAMEERLRPFVPERIVDQHGFVWNRVGLNNGFLRLIQYVRDGDAQPLHFDLLGNRLDSGVHPGCQDDETKGLDSICQTMLTFNMYLNPPERFYHGGDFTVLRSPSHEWFKLKPNFGRAFLFRQGQNHGFLHDAGETHFGADFPDGHKSILRIDMVYAPEDPAGWADFKERAKVAKRADGECPEVFATEADMNLHEGIHDDILTDGYRDWKDRLDHTYEAAAAALRAQNASGEHSLAEWSSFAQRRQAREPRLRQA